MPGQMNLRSSTTKQHNTSRAIIITKLKATSIDPLVHETASRFVFDFNGSKFKIDTVDKKYRAGNFVFLRVRTYSKDAEASMQDLCSLLKMRPLEFDNVLLEEKDDYHVFYLNVDFSIEMPA